MVIYPEIIVTPDTPTIKFHQPREQVDLNKELPRILHAQGWGCGTYFNVQFISHDKTKLLACAKFVVAEEVETLHTSDNQYQPMTKTVFSRRAERITDWWPPTRDSVMNDTMVFLDERTIAHAADSLASPPEAERQKRKYTRKTEAA